MSSSLLDAVTTAIRQAELEAAAAEAREIELSALERWARDPIGWINAFVWIASKFGGRRGRIRPMRMTLFPDQEATIEAWLDVPHLAETGELVFRNIVIEKSRQIGETWLFAAVLLWALIFHPIQGLALHRKAAEIADRGFTHKSLFGKIGFAYKRLAAEATPPATRLVFSPFSTDPAKVVNEANGATLHGEAQSDDPGRGGSFDVALVDEAAFVRHGENVYAAIDEACPEGKALLSTVNGSDNFHARIYDEEPQGWRRLRLHWSTHPLYSKGLHIAAIPPAEGQRRGRLSVQPTDSMRAAAAACELCQGTVAGLTWNARNPRAHRFPGKLASPHYDRAVIGKTAEQVASELDIDRERSLKARVYDEFTADLHVERDVDGTELEIGFDPRLPLELAFDYGLDVTAVVVCQDHPLEYRVIGEVEVVDQPGETPTPDVVARRLVEELRDLGVPERLLTPDWTRKLYAIGDPSGEGRGLETGRPLISAYRALGFEIRKPPSSMTRTVEPSIRAVKRLLLGTPKPLKVSGPRCPRFVRHMTHNRWPTDALGNRRLSASVPLDDEHNHMSRAFAYLAVAKFPPTPEAKGDRAGDPWGDEDQTAIAKTYGSLLDELEPLGYDAKA